MDFYGYRLRPGLIDLGNQDMTRLGNGMGNLREDMQDLKTNFCYGLLPVVVLVVILKTKMTNR